MSNEQPAGRTTKLGGTPFRLDGPELRVGDPAPDFNMVDASSQKVDLKSTGNAVRIFSVIPSLDTPVCDAQTKRFEEAADHLKGVSIYSISMDLPFAQKRWCGNFAIDHIVMLSDHRTASFGKNYGTLIEDLRIESRAIFVVDPANHLRYVEYVPEVGDHPNYEATMDAVKKVQAEVELASQ